MDKLLKKILPSKEKIKELSPNGLRSYFKNPALWRLSRQSVAKGVAVGLFTAVIPIMPFQMLLAVFLSVLLKGNIPIALGVSWVSNPLTLVPLTYFTYEVGAWFLHGKETILHYGKAFFIGLPIVAFGFAIIGYCLVMIIVKISDFFHKK